MKLTIVEARDLPDAWFQCVQQVMDEGYEYKIDRGSFAGQKRKEFDLVTVHVKYPGSRPLIPDVPQGVPPPTSMDFVEEYYRGYISGTSEGKDNELYTYGDDIVPQVIKILDTYKEDGPENNQCCISVGSKNSMELEHSQCLRLIDTRIRYGALHFIVYFRSWDLWGGFPVNMAGLQLLKEFMANWLKVKDGELIAFSKGLHLYDHCWSLANLVLRR